MNDIFEIVEIETASDCNRTCSYCPNKESDDHSVANKRELPADLVVSVFKQLAQMGFDGTMRFHFYNEPLLDTRLQYFLSEAKSQIPNVRNEVFSNGDLLTVELFDQLFSSGLDFLKVTLHEGRKPVNIDSVVSHAKAIGKSDQLEVRSHNALYLLNRGGILDINGRPMTKCEFPSERLVITSRGNVVLCCNDYTERNSFGNVYTESVDDIWQKPDFVKLRSNLAKGKFERKICIDCTSYNSSANLH